MSAAVALLDVPAQGRRAALFDGAHDATLLAVERVGVQMPVCRAVAAQDVRQLQQSVHGGSGVVNLWVG
jgi:hypothetical protein